MSQDPLKIQISLTEWLEKIGHPRAKDMRDEDNEKRERLKMLKQHIGLPFDEPFQCLATDVANRTAVYTAYEAEHGNELCAMRLIPLNPALPKLRMRGQSVRDVAATWFPAQKIDPRLYRVDLIPHPTTHLWSTIFVINQLGIFGEIVLDSHEQLSQGFHRHQPITFAFDFNEWKFSEENLEALAEMQTTVALLRVVDERMQTTLKDVLNATFANGYLCGYFESVTTTDFGRWFIDYNRVLGDSYTVTPVQKSGDGIRGQCGSPGVARGRVRIVPLEKIGEITLESDEILVCDMTTPEYVPLMKQAAGIVTDRGGILSHAAIVSRELGKPCVVGTRNATGLLKDGDLIEVDAQNGSVRLINR